ncbi:MAG: class I SAM-dependent methyltransferase, partial [Planctomycetes bacterium]|nr:class I SAM-dependent methyltransferase [Planctomycetota bacterium]
AASSFSSRFEAGESMRTWKLSMSAPAPAEQADDPTPEGVYRFLRYMNDRWEERARLNARYFTDTLNFDDERAWKVQADADVAWILSGLETEDLTGRRLLEIGCGPGRLLARLAPRFRHVVGVDLAPTMLRHVRETCRGVGHAGFVHSKGYDLGFFRDRSFDFIIMVAVAIHVPIEICTSYLRESRRVLRPGGHLRFTLRRALTEEDHERLRSYVAREAQRIPSEGYHLVSGADWNGHAFEDRAVAPYLAEFGFASVKVRKHDIATFWIEARI